jgi:hypothetical protein
MKKNISTTTVMKPTISVDVTAAQPEPTEDGAASVAPPYQAVVGLDVGDRQSHYCVLDLDGGVVTEREVAAVRVHPHERGDANCPSQEDRGPFFLGAAALEGLHSCRVWPRLARLFGLQAGRRPKRFRNPHHLTKYLTS